MGEGDAMGKHDDTHDWDHDNTCRACGAMRRFRLRPCVVRMKSQHEATDALEEAAR
jgi:hypothetical protein